MGLMRIAEAFEKAVAELALQDPVRPIVLQFQIFVLSALGKAQAKAGNREEAAKNFAKAVDIAAVMPAEGESLRSDRLGDSFATAWIRATSTGRWDGRTHRP